MSILFFHGVPDTPAVWQPLIAALGLAEGSYRAPALPGFGVPLPAGFKPHKDAYLDWMLGEIETAVDAAGGPVDIIAHDWGALLAVRAMSLRPELINRWVISGAVPDPDYRWHTTARRWQTPFVGELMMSITSPARLKAALVKAGLPDTIAEAEIHAWNRTMRRSILALYRSARHVATEWGGTLIDLPDRGLLVWGTDDPFVSIKTAHTFANKWNLSIHEEKNTGHWAIAEAATSISVAIKHHWTDDL